MSGRAPNSSARIRDRLRQRWDNELRPVARASHLDRDAAFEAIEPHIGYSPAHEEEYAKMKLRIGDEGLFRVEENFPRPTQTSFAGGIPSGVERVEYEINLSGFKHLRVATKPEEFVFE